MRLIAINFCTVLLLILKVLFYFLLKYGCHCVTSTFTEVNIYLVICTFTEVLRFSTSSTTGRFLLENTCNFYKRGINTRIYQHGVCVHFSGKAFSLMMYKGRTAGSNFKTPECAFLPMYMHNPPHR